MRNYASVIVFLILTVSSGIAGTGSYEATQNLIVSDMNRALAKTIAERHEEWTAADTIRAYGQLRRSVDGPIVVNATDGIFNRNLSIPQLRDKACLQLHVLAGGAGHTGTDTPAGGSLSSDTVIITSHATGMRVALRGYVRCSAATVLGLSDQRLPLSLCMAALLWALVSVAYSRRHRRQHIVGTSYGGIRFSAETDLFYDAANNPIHLTPMQHQLMQMFFLAEGHKLSRHDICNALWPKKEDAGDTLYTLIKRLRHTLETNSRLRIETDRGRAYTLTD